MFGPHSRFQAPFDTLERIEANKINCMEQKVFIKNIAIELTASLDYQRSAEIQAQYDTHRLEPFRDPNRDSIR